jgi:hypothetical protein
MYCIACGQVLPAEARFCAGCGRPVAGITSPRPSDPWEYRDFTVPFPGNLTPWYSLATSRPPVYARLPVQALRLIDRAAASLVQKMGAQGWEPAEPTDAGSLWKAKRVGFKIRPRDSLWALATMQARFDIVLTSLVIRFRRPATAAVPGAPAAQSAQTTRGL